MKSLYFYIDIFFDVFQCKLPRICVIKYVDAVSSIVDDLFLYDKLTFLLMRYLSIFKIIFNDLLTLYAAGNQNT